MQPPPPVSSPGVSTAAPQKSRRNVLLCIIGSVILLMFFMMSDSTSRHFQSFTDRSDYPGGDEFASLVLENPAARVPQNPKSYEFLHPENFHSVGPDGKKRRIFLITYVDAKSNNIGILYGALSKSCYARMHNYHSIIYSDKDLRGWVAPRRRHYRNEKEAWMAAKWWSKLFLMNKTFHQFKLTEDDWVFWLDSDTIITEPRYSIEDIIFNASKNVIGEDDDLPFSPDKNVNYSTSKYHNDHAGSSKNPNYINYDNIPDIIASNTYDGINNGVVGARPTAWTRRFLQDWWNDQTSNEVNGMYTDNGAFMHQVLREIVNDYNVAGKMGGVNNNVPQPYDNECHKIKLPDVDAWKPLIKCWKDMTRSKAGKVCRGNDNCLSRCPVSWQYGLDREAIYRKSAKEHRDFEYGWIPKFNRHIGYSCRINEGYGWEPVALYRKDWSTPRTVELDDPEESEEIKRMKGQLGSAEPSWLLHLAGRSKKEREKLMSELAVQVSDRFSPRCF